MDVTREALQALLERLEAAEGPDHELDIEIAKCLFPSPSGNVFLQYPGYTASLDASIALVEKIRPGWFCTFGICYLSAHAHLGVDYNGPHRDRLFKEFPVEKYDAGFDAELESGDDISTVCRALLHCLVQALIAEREEK